MMFKQPHSCKCGCDRGDNRTWLDNVPIQLCQWPNFIKNIFVIIVHNLKINATSIFDSKAHSVIWFALLSA
jgi:hypothetical protein